MLSEMEFAHMIYDRGFSDKAARAMWRAREKNAEPDEMDFAGPRGALRLKIDTLYDSDSRSLKRSRRGPGSSTDAR